MSTEYNALKKKKEGKPGKQKQNAKESAKGHSQGLTK